MGSILQKFLRALSPDGERPHQHVTVGCCSTIRIDEHEQENTQQPIKEDESSSE